MNYLYHLALSRNLFPPSSPRNVIVKGLPMKEVDELLAHCQRRTDMFRMQKLGYEAAAKEFAAQGKIDHKEFMALVGKKAREFAKKEKFDLDLAQAELIGSKPPNENNK
ncbi:hypothetical protein HNR65_003614 [Desulfosalsimonas propionicica]|uniref:Uncharacterized protein n=1 Tax=Desulfosalsimonas propionicica TaxID=332175 RepID=A0A7W0CCI4_9BACT|nr:hypothetical protein [Desulfosalsimonas propionicica]MBA2883252.1 hypothetical protein [Desulfosalsimonas propionicica]